MTYNNPNSGTNVSPYYDDFNDAKGFLRMLFRPGRAVQGRELTQIQTLLQDQLGKHADHIFKDRTVITGGGVGVATSSIIRATPRDDIDNFTPTDFIGEDIYGVTGAGTDDESLITTTSADGFKKARVVHAVAATADDPYDVYFISELSGATFGPGDIFKSLGASADLANITNITIPSELDSNYTGITGYSLTGNASIVTVDEGIFYVDKFFVKTTKQRFAPFGDHTANIGGNDVSLRLYTDNVSKSVGFNIGHEIVEYTSDPSLLDPSSGTSNFTAPGADRYKMNLTLDQKDYDLPTAGDTEIDSNLVSIQDYFEMVRLFNGNIQNLMNTTQYSGLDGYLASRTFDESGNYVVDGFFVELREHLRDIATDKFKDGMFTASQGGVTGNYALMVGPGKAYVEGFPYRLHGETIVSIDKPRNADAQNSIVGENVVANLGLHVKVDNNANGITLSTSTADFDNMQEVFFFGPTSLSFDGTTAGAAGNVGGIIGKGKLRHLINRQTHADVFLADVEMGFSGGLRYPFYLIDSIHGICANAPQTNGDVSGFGDGLAGVGPQLMSINTANGKVEGAGLTAGMVGTRGFESEHTGNVFLVDKNSVKAIDGLDYTGRVAITKTVNASNNIVEFKTSDFNNSVVPDASRVKFPVVTADGETISTSSVAVYVNDTNEFLTAVSSTPSDGTECFFFGNTDDGTGRDTLKIEVNASHAGDSITIFTSIIVDDAGSNESTIIREKTPKLGITAGITFAAVAQNTGTVEATIPYSDVFKINSVHLEVGGVTTGSDIKDKFLFDLGQKPTFYDHAKLTTLNSSGLSGGDRVVVDFDYYEHTGNSNRFGPFTVESYPDYESIPSIFLPNLGIVSLRDCLDFRPARANVADSTDFNSVFVPFHSTSDDQNAINVNYTHYMGRIDQLYLRNDKTMILQKGEPAIFRPVPPPVEDGMLLATIKLPPYVYDVNDIDIRLEDNTRFTMRDIGNIKDKVDRIEYYTSLSLLEQNAENQLIVDSDGLPRFKNGILVEPFHGHFVGDISDPDYNIFIDDELNLGTCPQANSNVDLEELTKSGLVLTNDDCYVLPSTRETLINQTVRSNKISVNPYNVVSFTGDMTLRPESDVWNDTTTLPVRNISRTIDARVQGAGIIAAQMGTVLAGTNTQVAGILEGAGEAEQAGRAAALNRWGWWAPPPNVFGGFAARNQFFRQQNLGNNFRTFNRRRSRRRIDVFAQVRTQRFQASESTTSQTTNLGNRVVETRVIPFMRARNIRINVVGLRPNTRMYAFFDGQDVNDRCTPANYGTSRATITTNGSAGDELRADENGKLALHFNLQNGVFRTGIRKFKLSDSSTNSSQLETCFAEADYQATGLRSVTQQTNMTTSVRRTRFERTAAEWTDAGQVAVRWVDPVSQTILISADDYPSGVFVKDVDLFFANKDASLPVSCELRPVVNGYPSSGEHIPLAKVTLDPEDVIAGESWDDLEASNGQAYTKFEFATPIYLTPGEYCIVVISNSDIYEVWHSTMGEFKLDGDGSVSDVKVTEQPYMGSFFKSQNASTWTADQNSDLCFRLGICNFNTGESPLSGQLQLKATLATNDEAKNLYPYATGLTNGSTEYQVLRFHELQPHFTEMAPGNTNLSHSVAVKNLTQIANDGDTRENIPISNESTIVTGERKAVVVSSDSGLMGSNDQQSLIYTINFSGTELLTPVIDAERMSNSITEYQINNNKNLDVVYNQELINGVTANAGVSASASGSYNGELEPSSFGDNAPIARYISKPVVLEETINAQGLSVFLTQEVPVGSEVHVFARFLPEDAETNIRRERFVRLLPTQTPPKEFGFREVEYKLQTEETFGQFQVKAVLYADETKSIIPLIKDLRAVAVT